MPIKVAIIIAFVFFFSTQKYIFGNFDDVTPLDRNTASTVKETEPSAKMPPQTSSNADHRSTLMLAPGQLRCRPCLSINANPPQLRSRFSFRLDISVSIFCCFIFLLVSSCATLQCRRGRHCSGVMHRALQTDSISVVEHSPLLRRSSNLSHKGQVTLGAKRRPSPKNCAISQIMQQRA